CPMFSGKSGISIAEWAEEVQACARARYLPAAEQALFMVDHLEGEAKEEIKFRPREEQRDPGRVLAILKELYGCSQSYVTLQQAFFSRQQLEGETLQEFSLALMSLMARVERQAPNGIPNADVLLRDQFVEHVLDGSLRRELKQLVRRQPTITLLELRGEAIRWEREGLPGGTRGRSVSLPTAYGLQYGVQGRPHQVPQARPQEPGLDAVMDLLKRQQEQLNQLTMTVASLQAPPPLAPISRSGPLICRRCQQPGHFARECDAVGKLKPTELPSHSSVGGSTGSPSPAITKLIAPCPNITVLIGGIGVECLVDTGSMVSTITESFFRAQFGFWGHDRLQSCQWLQLRAANGLAIPYVGYLELEVELCGKVIPCCGILVVKDPPGASSSPGILGMNVIRRCYQELFGVFGSSLFESPFVSGAPGPVVAALQKCHQTAVQPNLRFSGQSVLFEPPQSGLPAGLLASPCLLRVVRGTVWVPVVNVGEAGVLLYPRVRLGVVNAAQVVSLPAGITEVGLTTATLASQSAVPSVLDRIGSWDLSALTELEQASVRSLLDQYSSVFAANDEYEAVKMHINQLLESQVICESSSPYASPIVLVRKKDGGLRLCVDYRLLNSKTRKDAFPLPHIEESLDALSGAAGFPLLTLPVGAVSYLGHIISSQGVSTDPKKIEAVAGWQCPRHISELRSFLGFASYYRRFVDGFAKMAKPLHQLVADLAGTKTKRGSGRALGSAWTPECEESFNALKSRLVSTPVLAYADFSRPFILETDASHSGLGAVLSQETDGCVRPVAYASRGLRPTERNMSNYSSMKLEFLALKWAVTEKFREYLLGHKCIVYTDNNPLSHLQSAKLGAAEHRWAAELAAFDLEIKYRSGRNNRNADALSRQYAPTPDCAIPSLPGTSVPCSLQPNIQPGPMVGALQSLISILPSHSPADLHLMQEEDPVLKEVLVFWRRGSLPTSAERRQLSQPAIVLLRQWDRLVEKNGVLFRRVFRSDGGENNSNLFCPRCSRGTPCISSTRSMGIKAQKGPPSWCGNAATGRECHPTSRSGCTACERCQVAKDSGQVHRSYMGHLLASRPNEILAVDFTLLEPSRNGFENVLVMTDVFSKFTVAVPTRDQRAVTVAQVLVTEWFYSMGFQVAYTQTRAEASRVV
ncbi:Retrovirus-related Pol polyprotein from transposon opus, partial [Takifugu flavidus]